MQDLCLRVGKKIKKTPMKVFKYLTVTEYTNTAVIMSDVID